MMETLKFPSGIVKAFNYDRPRQYLDVITRDGFVFRYFDVPESTLENFKKSENPGIYYMKMIRNKYKRLFRSFDSL